VLNVTNHTAGFRHTVDYIFQQSLYIYTRDSWEFTEMTRLLDTAGEF